MTGLRSAAFTLALLAMAPAAAAATAQAPFIQIGTLQCDHAPSARPEVFACTYRPFRDPDGAAERFTATIRKTRAGAAPLKGALVWAVVATARGPDDLSGDYKPATAPALGDDALSHATIALLPLLIEGGATGPRAAVDVTEMRLVRTVP